jgi:hypothetical protein
MGLRQALNVCFAMLTLNLDSDDRRVFEEKLNGWDQQQERANRALWEGRISGGSEDG